VSTPLGVFDHVYCSNSNKVRIIALYIQYREGVPDEDRRRLYHHARLSRPEIDAVNSLVHLGVRISRVRIKFCNDAFPKSSHTMGICRRDRETRISSDASSKSDRTKRSTSSLDTNPCFALSLRYVFPIAHLYPSPLAAQLVDLRMVGDRTKSLTNSIRLLSRTSRTTPKPTPPQRVCKHRDCRQPRCVAQGQTGIVRPGRAVQRAKRASGCSCSSLAG
jgi:hypothetical protein